MVVYFFLLLILYFMRKNEKWYSKCKPEQKTHNKETGKIGKKKQKENGKRKPNESPAGIS